MSAVNAGDVSNTKIASRVWHWSWLDKRCTAENYPSLVMEMLALADRSQILDMENDPRWLAAIADEEREPRAFILRDGDGVLHGYALLWSHPTSLQYRFGEFTYLSVKVRRRVLTTAPVLSAQAELDPGVISELLSAFRAAAAGLSPFYLQGIPSTSELFKVCSSSYLRRQGFIAVWNGPLYERRFIEFEGSFEHYAKQLGAGTRQDLKRTVRKVKEALPDVRLRVFASHEDIDPFLEDAEQVSRKTYQWRLLGEGVGRSPWLLKLLRAAAELGSFRSYVLYAGSQPIAFQLGYLHRGTYFAHNIGYDPEYAKFQPGVFLHHEIVNDLCRADVQAARFDFLFGDGKLKSRLSTSARAEGSVYLFPGTLKGSIAAMTLRAANSASAVASTILQKYGLKERVKKLLRRQQVGVSPKPRANDS